MPEIYKEIKTVAEKYLEENSIIPMAILYFTIKLLRAHPITYKIGPRLEEVLDSQDPEDLYRDIKSYYESVVQQMDIVLKRKVPKIPTKTVLNNVDFAVSASLGAIGAVWTLHRFNRTEKTRTLLEEAKTELSSRLLENLDLLSLGKPMKNMLPYTRPHGKDDTLNLARSIIFMTSQDMED